MVLLSNSDTPFIRELYSGFRIKEVNVQRAINCKGSKRIGHKELLISNFLPIVDIIKCLPKILAIVWKNRGDIRDVISIGKLVRKSNGAEQIEMIMETMTKYGSNAPPIKANKMFSGSYSLLQVP